MFKKTLKKEDEERQEWKLWKKDEGNFEIKEEGNSGKKDSRKSENRGRKLWNKDQKNWKKEEENSKKRGRKAWKKEAGNCEKNRTESLKIRKGILTLKVVFKKNWIFRECFLSWIIDSRVPGLVVSYNCNRAILLKGNSTTYVFDTCQSFWCRFWLQVFFSFYLNSSQL